MGRLLLCLAILPAVFGQLKFDRSKLNEDRAGNRVKPELIFEATGPPICPDEDGTYEDIDYCDSYWECTNLEPVQKWCEDGLVFAPSKAGHADPCDTPFVVSCGDRQLLQEPTFGNEYCPRKYGTFEHPDPTICNIYYQCVNNVFTETKCSTGLHFNGTQGSCNWPHIALRTGCVEKEKVSQDGLFSCPKEITYDSTGARVLHPSFPNADDCAKFYVCLNGETPQDASCDKGLVFNERSMLCSLPEEVPECDGWYANDPEFAHYYESLPANSRNDPGNQDVVG